MNSIDGLKSKKIENLFFKIITTLKYSIFFWAFWGVLATFINKVFLKVIVIIIFAFFSAPSYIGYLKGFNYVNSLKTKNLCKEPILNKSYKEDTNLCSIFTIKGHKIWGDILLSTNDGYIFRRDGYFAYISKNGDNCAFSHYQNSDKLEKSFTFRVDQDIQSLCFKKIAFLEGSNS